MNTLAVIGGLNKAAGGTSYSVPSWSNTLARLGVQGALLTERGCNEEMSGFLDEERINLITVRSFSVKGTNLRWSPATATRLARICRESAIDLIHNHGVWLPINHYCSTVSRRMGIPLVITPHGMLTKWSFSYRGWKKRLAWRLYQGSDLNQARVVHLTSANEEDDLRCLGFKGTTAVIPNGIDLPSWQEGTSLAKPCRTALFVSRIHPKKGLLNLVEAWKRVRPKGWQMRLVGPDEAGHLAAVQAAVKAHGLESEFIYCGSLYGDALWDTYRQSDLLILPTMSENFGNVVPEALSCGVPVITTYGAPWEELKTHSCGWWIPIGVDPLADALREATEATVEERRQMGLRGRRLVEEKYTWDSVGRQMKTLYEWILGGGARPAFVHTK